MDVRVQNGHIGFCNKSKYSLLKVLDSSSLLVGDFDVSVIEI